MTPLFDRLLVRKKPMEEVTTDGGILLDADKLEVAHERGEVVSIGSDVAAVAVGDVAWFQKNSGSPILMPKGETLFLLRQEQLDLVE